MNDYPVPRGARPGDPHPRLRLAALTAVIVGVILVALAAFLLSYTGIHQIALQAGVSPGLARLYPLMFDAMLIITCSAVLATRTAGWGTKTYVWVCLLLVVGAVAGGGALHATGVHLTGQAARAAIAVIPWVLLLLGFGIWLVMLRHWRRIRMPGAEDAAEAHRAAPADRNGQAGRAVPVDRARQAAPAAQTKQTAPVAPTGQTAPTAPARQPAPVAPAGQAGRAAPATAAGAAAGIAGKATGTATETRPGTPAETKTAPGTADTPAGTNGTPAGTDGTAARTATDTKPGSTAATPGTSDPGAGAEAGAGAGTTGTAEAGRDGGGKDKAPVPERPRRLGGLLEMPASADDQEGSVRILPAEPKASPEDAAAKTEGEAGEAGIPAGAAVATEPDPANPPAPLPHFDRPRSTPTPPRETGADGE